MNKLLIIASMFLSSTVFAVDTECRLSRDIDGNQVIERYSIPDGENIVATEHKDIRITLAGQGPKWPEIEIEFKGTGFKMLAHGTSQDGPLIFETPELGYVVFNCASFKSE